MSEFFFSIPVSYTHLDVYKRQTYTTSFWLIDQIGYWTPWITPEDFHIFFKSLFKFPDKVSTVPLFLKTMSDAAEGSTHTETIKNNYFQQRRWIWGVTIDGWMLSQVAKLTFCLLYTSHQIICELE